MGSKIQWTNETWNPVTGCDAVSAGCQNCYAKVMANRLYKMGVHKYRNNFKVTLHPEELDKPLRWRKPRMIFVNSMSDLFHPDVPIRFVHTVGNIIDRCPQHIFQILTKRPERMKNIIGVSLANVWLGTTVENQTTADERIPHLLSTPASVRFLSCEPLLSEIDLRKSMHNKIRDRQSNYHINYNTAVDIKKWLHWVIIGCESGANRRPCNLDWVYSLVDQCQNAGVPVFVKQIELDGKVVKDVDKFPKDLQIREWPE